jgi:hypothetical protein
MSVLAIVLIVVTAVLLLFFLGGLAVARRRRDRPGWEEHVGAADQALEQARAADRGWDRELLHEAARRALAEGRPGFVVASLELVLVDDRPGMGEDRAHLMAAGAGESIRVVLARDESGLWGVEKLD